MDSDTESPSVESAILDQDQMAPVRGVFDVSKAARPFGGGDGDSNSEDDCDSEKAPSQEIPASLPPAGVLLSEVSPRTAAADNVSGVPAPGAQRTAKATLDGLLHHDPESKPPTTRTATVALPSYGVYAQVTAPHAGRDVKFTGKQACLYARSTRTNLTDEQKHWMKTKLMAWGHVPFHPPSKEVCEVIVVKGVRGPQTDKCEPAFSRHDPQPLPTGRWNPQLAEEVPHLVRAQQPSGAASS